MCLSLDNALANPSTGSSYLFHHETMTKTPNLDKLPNATNMLLKLHIPNTLLKI